MKSLKDILYGVGLSAVSGSTSLLINEICFDSRSVGMDDVFVAIKGVLADGHQYIEKAVAGGANSIVCEVLPEVLVNGVTYVVVDNAHSALSIMAANYYDNPSKNLKL
ncbi:MAG TPA: Mur ligase domain-containing protein, partial [Arenibacter sp.]|nr:Mur ligase domain-containing protein [Arenibacter sp.]